MSRVAGGRCGGDGTDLRRGGTICSSSAMAACKFQKQRNEKTRQITPFGGGKGEGVHS